ncbi:hypothetical protein J3R30DRAFT_3417294 [Lentinula aciculospora]|uniref:FAD-binding domain-containing protein n=1 Tax=Lentinula aciculospora TaxID=153920 RepID=A0A9W9AUT7_9AGAR|nr:hypothetical protein J3R30DRAFT_3417294 [Lentinula aciculospora]
MSVSRKPSQAFLKLDVLIVGGGIGGLATANALARVGHRVTVVEAVEVAGEIGAGIQLAANVTRILIRWGLGPKLEEIAGLDNLKYISLYRYEDGMTLLHMPYGNEGEQRYGAPTYHVHRADFYDMLYDLAKPYITFRPGSRVVSVDPLGPSVVLESGEKISADIIIGADGIRSVVRDIVLGGSQQAKYTGDSAYRFLIPTEDMLLDPDLRPLVENASVSVWTGPQKHLVGYGIRGKSTYNVVACVEDGDEKATYSWTAKSDTNGLRTQFAGWEPRIGKLLALIRSPYILKYKLMDCAPLTSWVHQQGRVALVGDACHPMLPYRAQGAAMAVEDAECLGVLFSHITNLNQIPSLLKAYEDIRYERATTTQRLSTENRETYHLPDGPEQQARDSRLQLRMKAHAAVANGEFISSENRSIVERGMRSRQQEDDLQYGYDISLTTERWWQENGTSTLQDKN